MKLRWEILIIVIIGLFIGSIVSAVNHFLPIHIISTELCSETHTISRRGSCRASFLLLLAPALCATLYFLSILAVRRLLTTPYPFAVSFFAATLFWAFAFYLLLVTDIYTPLAYLLLTIGSICSIGFSYWYMTMRRIPMLYKIITLPFIVALISYLSHFIFSRFI